MKRLALYLLLVLVMFAFAPAVSEARCGCRLARVALLPARVAVRVVRSPFRLVRATVHGARGLRAQRLEGGCSSGGRSDAEVVPVAQ